MISTTVVFIACLMLRMSKSVSINGKLQSPWIYWPPCPPPPFHNHHNIPRFGIPTPQPAVLSLFQLHWLPANYSHECLGNFSRPGSTKIHPIDSVCSNNKCLKMLEGKNIFGEENNRAGFWGVYINSPGWGTLAVCVWSQVGLQTSRHSSGVQRCKPSARTPHAPFFGWLKFRGKWSHWEGKPQETPALKIRGFKCIIKSVCISAWYPSIVGYHTN